MPLFDFQCNVCGRVEEKLLSYRQLGNGEGDPTACGHKVNGVLCHGTMRRKVGRSMIKIQNGPPGWGEDHDWRVLP